MIDLDDNFLPDEGLGERLVVEDLFSSHLAPKYSLGQRQMTRSG
jgi:hypothetical protein